MSAQQEFEPTRSNKRTRLDLVMEERSRNADKSSLGSRIQVLSQGLGAGKPKAQDWYNAENSDSDAMDSQGIELQYSNGLLGTSGEEFSAFARVSLGHSTCGVIFKDFPPDRNSRKEVTVAFSDLSASDVYPLSIKAQNSLFDVLKRIGYESLAANIPNFQSISQSELISIMEKDRLMQYWISWAMGSEQFASFKAMWPQLTRVYEEDHESTREKWGICQGGYWMYSDTNFRIVLVLPDTLGEEAAPPVTSVMSRATIDFVVRFLLLYPRPSLKEYAQKLSKDPKRVPITDDIFARGAATNACIILDKLMYFQHLSALRKRIPSTIPVQFMHVTIDLLSQVLSTLSSDLRAKGSPEGIWQDATKLAAILDLDIRSDEFKKLGVKTISNTVSNSSIPGVGQFIHELLTTHRDHPLTQHVFHTVEVVSQGKNGDFTIRCSLGGRATAQSIEPTSHSVAGPSVSQSAATTHNPDAPPTLVDEHTTHMPSFNQLSLPHSSGYSQQSMMEPSSFVDPELARQRWAEESAGSSSGQSNAFPTGDASVYYPEASSSQQGYTTLDKQAFFYNPGPGPSGGFTQDTGSQLQWESPLTGPPSAPQLQPDGSFMGKIFQNNN